MRLPKLAEIDLLMTHARSLLDDFADDSLWARDFKRTKDELMKVVGILNEAISLLDKVEEHE